MKVTLLTARATATGSQNVGDEVEVSDAEGQRLVEAGIAKPVRATKPEKAVTRKRPEKASHDV